MKSIKKTENTYSSYDHIDAKESDYLYIAKSQIPDAGNGLFTAISIWKNEIISLFKGEILSDDQANERAKLGDNKYFINMLDGRIMDSMNVKCLAKYANDSEGFVKTNFKLNSIITIDEKNSICIVAKRNIKAGEEIFCSYGIKYWRKYKDEIIKSSNKSLNPEEI